MEVEFYRRLTRAVGYGDVNGDGVDDRIAILRRHDSKSFTNTTDVAAFDGLTLKQLWLTGLSEELSAKSVAVVDGRVAVADERATLHFFELSNGRAAGALRLSDGVRDMCAIAGKLYVATKDEQFHSVDVRSAADVPAKAAECEPQPTACDGAPRGDECYVQSEWMDFAGHAQKNMVASLSPDERSFVIPGIPGVRQTRRLRAPSGVTLVRGMKSPGSKVPVIAAFDSSRAVLWRFDFPVAPALEPNNLNWARRIGDLFVMSASIDIDIEHPLERIVAVDVTSGRPRWQRDLPLCNSVDAPGTRLLLNCGDDMTLLDLATGETLAERPL